MSKQITAGKKSDRMIDIGEIMGAHVVKGQLKVMSLTDFEDIRFAVGAKVYVQKLKKSPPGGYGRRFFRAGKPHIGGRSPGGGYSRKPWRKNRNG